MFQEKNLLFLSAVSPMHVGTGSELGLVDLPIQREKHTGYPKIEGSSLKGALREAIESRQDDAIKDFGKVEKQDIEHLFGPEEIKGADDGYAGAMGFSDARLFLFPVKSMKGVFAWITSPMVLTRLQTELELIGQKADEIKNALSKFNEINKNSAKALTAMDAKLFVNYANNAGKIVLEEFAMDAVKDVAMCKLAEWCMAHTQAGQDSYRKGLFKTNLVMVGDDAFSDFVTLSTEVITRIKINNETGTVQEGALFTEEYLPAESILYSLIMAGPVFQEKSKKGKFAAADGKEEAKKVMQFFNQVLPEVVQIGGNATLGKGIVQTKIC